MQETTIIGNIGKDAEVKSVNGREVINFIVAVNRNWKDNAGTKHTETTWYYCAKWINPGQSKAVVAYLTKGTQVLVRGLCSPTLYKTKNNETAIDMRLRIDDVKLLSSSKASDGAPAQNQPAAQTNTGDPAQVADPATATNSNGTMPPNNEFLNQDNDDLLF